MVIKLKTSKSGAEWARVRGADGFKLIVRQGQAELGTATDIADCGHRSACLRSLHTLSLSLLLNTF